MRTCLCIAFGIAVTAASVTAHAGPKEDASQVIDLFAKAFRESDEAAMMKLFVPGAQFFGTGSKALVTDEAGIRKYFEVLQTTKPKVAEIKSYSAKELSDGVVVLAGLDALGGTRDGKPYSSDGRFTIVAVKTARGWQIAQFHRSVVPQ